MGEVGQNVPNLTAVDEDASLELDQLWVLGRCLGGVTDFGITPAVDGDVKGGSGLETGDKTGHDRDTDRPM